MSSPFGKTLFILLTASTCLYANGTEENTVEKPPLTAEAWLNDHLKEKDAPDWVSEYMVCIDDLITETNAHTYFRRFISDRNTRLDGVQKFVEYLSLAGYPESLIKDQNSVTPIKDDDVYKAIYFAITYTIMDGLPIGPPVRGSGEQ